MTLRLPEIATVFDMIKVVVRGILSALRGMGKLGQIEIMGFGTLWDRSSGALRSFNSQG